MLPETGRFQGAKMNKHGSLAGKKKGLICKPSGFSNFLIPTQSLMIFAMTRTQERAKRAAREDPDAPNPLQRPLDQKGGKSGEFPS
jgi:hypothetical protein